ncbi:MAG: hypothetical protein WCG47_05500, partial [Dermatophilaceae bacterium]
GGGGVAGGGGVSGGGALGGGVDEVGWVGGEKVGCVGSLGCHEESSSGGFAVGSVLMIPP